MVDCTDIYGSWPEVSGNGIDIGTRQVPLGSSITTSECIEIFEDAPQLFAQMEPYHQV